MLLRAAFWMAVAAIVIVPRETAMGPPDVPAMMPAAAARWVARTVKHVPPCSDATPCLGGLPLVGDFRDAVIARLARAGQQIRAADRDSSPFK